VTWIVIIRIFIVDKLSLDQQEDPSLENTKISLGFHGASQTQGKNHKHIFLEDLMPPEPINEEGARTEYEMRSIDQIADKNEMFKFWLKVNSHYKPHVILRFLNRR